jgi:hypothetical protein
MEMNNLDSFWVEQSISIVHKSAYYQEVVVDEWYETLPVLFWDENGSWILISFGRNEKTSDPKLPMRPTPPHLSCLVHYPGREMKWKDVTQDSRWINWNPLSVANVQEAKGKVMERRQRYYSALSNVLGLMAFPKNTLPSVVDSKICNSMIVARNTLFAAANPLLSTYYTIVTTPIENFLQQYCRGAQLDVTAPSATKEQH